MPIFFIVILLNPIMPIWPFFIKPSHPLTPEIVISLFWPSKVIFSLPQVKKLLMLLNSIPESKYTVKVPVVSLFIIVTG